MGTYPVQPTFSCNPTNNVHKKNLKDFTVVLLTLLYLHIEFQDQIHKNKKTVKR
jgi:hypothetical protein